MLHLVIVSLVIASLQSKSGVDRMRGLCSDMSATIHMPHSAAIRHISPGILQHLLGSFLPPVSCELDQALPHSQSEVIQPRLFTPTIFLHVAMPGEATQPRQAATIYTGHAETISMALDCLNFTNYPYLSLIDVRHEDNFALII